MIRWSASYRRRKQDGALHFHRSQAVQFRWYNCLSKFYKKTNSFGFFCKPCNRISIHAERNSKASSHWNNCHVKVCHDGQNLELVISVFEAWKVSLEPGLNGKELAVGCLCVNKNNMWQVTTKGTLYLCLKNNIWDSCNIQDKRVLQGVPKKQIEHW